MQDDLLKTCKSPEKGRKNKIEDGIFCSKTKVKFLIKLSKDLACEEPIWKDPQIPEIYILTFVAHQATIIELKGGKTLVI